ncbi:BTAD domain-containing putative transcriptional regulator [Paenibacillus sp.]|uniref:BTAD domain-containing putative transcriptional regulator n=1 Tax=Paenibacillus sp. TaxID=58172 RepID=UPI002D3F0774|nr:BTAD domain-containing putative transcriptional regulator [Paenibacillus sp.]HZG56196.1 BTAD domain-containing putative transcriptional regulator [Paenibacillus sp.]
MLRAILIDDERSAIDALQDVLAEFGEIEVAASFTNPVEALARMRDLRFHVVFLDIEMPGMKGLELAEAVAELDASAQIVFVTAYDQYAIEAFEVNAVDYLLKPVRLERMRKTVRKLSAAVASVEPPDAPNEGSVACFGAFGFTVHPAADTVKWRTNKVKELFAYLVHHRDASVRKEKIIEDLWPAMDASRAVAYLHTCIYQIRKTIRDARLEQRILLTYSNDCYRFAMDGIDCDAERFQRAMERIGGVTTDTIVACEQAAALYRGPYLAEDGFPWAAPVRERLSLQYAELVKSMVRHYMKENQLPQAVFHLRRQLADEPFEEEAHRLLMTCYARQGDRAALVRHYQEMERQLWEELGVPPDPSTEALYRSLAGSGS